MLNGDRANFLRRAAARDAGDGAAAQQLAARFDVGSGKQHTAGSGHARHASASGGPCTARSSRPRQRAAGRGRSSRPRQEAAARGRRRGGTAMAAGREKLEEISRVKVDQGLYLFIQISDTERWERKNHVEDGYDWRVLCPFSP